jgi:Flp pilus assembly protein TadD
MNQPDEASPLLKQVVKADATNGIAHRDLGVIFADQGNKADAITEFRTAITINPKDVNAHYRLARLYRSMGRASEAKIEFDKARSLNKAEDERLLKIMSTIPSRKQASNPTPQQPQ